MKKLLFLLPFLLLAGCGDKTLTPEELQAQAVTTCTNTIYEAITKTAEGKDLQKTDLTFKVENKSCSWEKCTVFWSISKWDEIKPFSCTTKYDLPEVVQYQTDFYGVWTWEDEIWNKLNKELEETAVKEPVEETPKTPREYQNALGSANSYVDYGAFSQKRLREQLEFEWYTAEAVDYAMENVRADYKEECLQNAESYLENWNFSQKRLREQLEYEGYTTSEIDYAMEHIDW